jgi:hypothetical protein
MRVRVGDKLCTATSKKQLKGSGSQKEKSVKQRTHWLLLAAVLCTFSLPLGAQEVEVDISACRGMYTVLKAMHEGALKE